MTVVTMQCHHDRTPHNTVCQVGHGIISVYSCQKCVPQPQGDTRGTFSRPELTQEADGQGQGGAEGPSQMGGGQGGLVTNATWDLALIGTETTQWESW